MNTLPSNLVSLLRFGFKWLCLSLPLGCFIGAACAAFLIALDKVTAMRFAYPWLLWLLPVAAMASALVYKKICGKSHRGSNLLIEEIHTPGGGVPARMAPLVFLATLVSHLTGASVGREGTAIQMGGSMAGTLRKLLPSLIKHEDVPMLLMAGIAGGFGGVFGTPIAGAVFAAEVLTRGSVRYRALGACLIAAFSADFVTRNFGVRHAPLGDLVSGLPAIGLFTLLQILFAALCFGLVAALFIHLSHSIENLLTRVTTQAWIRAGMGGCITIALVYVVGNTDYLGLGVDSPNPQATTIITCFFIGGAATAAWLWKILFTAVATGSGIKGGEVTPLFFIGAALGNTLAEKLNIYNDYFQWHFPRAPASLFAALGLTAVFAGAANAPLACTIMGMELFGAQFAPLFAIACFGSYVVSGKKSIYQAQQSE